MLVTPFELDLSAGNDVPRPGSTRGQKKTLQHLAMLQRHVTVLARSADMDRRHPLHCTSPRESFDFNRRRTSWARRVKRTYAGLLPLLAGQHTRPPYVY